MEKRRLHNTKPALHNVLPSSPNRLKSNCSPPSLLLITGGFSSILTAFSFVLGQYFSAIDLLGSVYRLPQREQRRHRQGTGCSPCSKWLGSYCEDETGAGTETIREEPARHGRWGTWALGLPRRQEQPVIQLAPEGDSGDGGLRGPQREGQEDGGHRAQGSGAARARRKLAACCVWGRRMRDRREKEGQTEAGIF